MLRNDSEVSAALGKPATDIRPWTDFSPQDRFRDRAQAKAKRVDDNQAFFTRAEIHQILAKLVRSDI